MVERGQILVVDDDPGVREPACAWLHAAGLAVHGAATAGAALALLEGLTPDVVLLDLELPDRSGLEVLRLLTVRQPQLPVLVLTAHREAEVAVDCMKAGAFDYLVKPVDEPRLLTAVANALHRRQVALAMASLERAVVQSGADPRTPLWRRVEAVAGRDLSAVILGGNPAARASAAQALHGASPRAGGPFLPLGCGGPSGAELIARTLAPDPALARGTLFLDDVEALGPTGQELLLAFLARAAQARAAGVAEGDVRVLAGSGANLDAAVQAGRLRADLFMRLAVDRLRLDAPGTGLEARATGAGPAATGPVDSLKLAERERTAILEALAWSQGNRSEASRHLGVSRSTLYRKLKEHGIE